MYCTEHEPLRSNDQAVLFPAVRGQNRAEPSRAEQCDQLAGNSPGTESDPDVNKLLELRLCADLPLEFGLRFWGPVRVVMQRNRKLSAAEETFYSQTELILEVLLESTVSVLQRPEPEEPAGSEGPGGGGDSRVRALCGRVEPNRDQKACLSSSDVMTETLHQTFGLNLDLKNQLLKNRFCF